MDLKAQFERHLADDDLTWECCVCLNPKTPFVTLAPCGHSLCRDCSTSITKCPLCEAPIESRVESQELTQVALSRIIYRCKKPLCGFRGHEREAREHNCRIYRFREIGPHIPDGEFAQLILSIPAGATDDEIVLKILDVERSRDVAPPPTVTVTAAPISPASPAAPRPAALYWDYDNVMPRFLGTSVSLFVTDMIDALKKSGVAVRDSYAYLVAGKDYQTDPDKLKDLQVSMRLSGTKREQADRDLSQDIRRRARELEEVNKRGVFVIVSSDKDFNSDVKELVNAGHDVWIVHNAVKGSDHERALKLWATGTIHVSNFARSATPPRYRGAPRTVSEEQLATVHRSRSQPRTRSPAVRPVPITAAPAAGEPTVRVGENPVAVAWLLPNAGLDFLQANPGKSGKWCTNKEPHQAATCAFLHIAPGYIIAEYVARPVSDVLHNEAVQYLESTPGAMGKWCRNTSLHDPSTCHFLHPVPGAARPIGTAVTPRADVSPSTNATRLLPGSPMTAPVPLAGVSSAAANATHVSVDGKPIALDRLVRNRAVDFLLSHPGANARTCANARLHDAAQCNFVHYVSVGETFLVEGRPIAVSKLIPNPALKYLKEHPTASGKWCTNKKPHDVTLCTYMHELPSA